MRELAVDHVLLRDIAEHAREEAFRAAMRVLESADQNKLTPGVLGLISFSAMQEQVRILLGHEAVRLTGRPDGWESVSDDAVIRGMQRIYRALSACPPTIEAINQAMADEVAAITGLAMEIVPTRGGWVMVAYDFQPEFVGLIRSGKKTTTVRKTRNGRSRHAKPGDQLQLYTGRRRPGAELIGRAVCKAVTPVVLRFVDRGRNEGVTWFWPGDPRFAAAPSHMRELNAFARADGFTGWAQLKAFFADHHPGVDPFEGVLIEWGELL